MYRVFGYRIYLVDRISGYSVNRISNIRLPNITEYRIIPNIRIPNITEYSVQPNISIFGWPNIFGQPNSWIFGWTEYSVNRIFVYSVEPNIRFNRIFGWPNTEYMNIRHPWSISIGLLLEVGGSMIFWGLQIWFNGEKEILDSGDSAFISWTQNQHSHIWS